MWENMTNTRQSATITVYDCVKNQIDIENKVIILDWMEVTCILPNRRALEAVTDIFNEYFPGGTMVDDPQAILQHVESNDWDAHEFSEDILARDHLKVSGFFEEDENYSANYARLKSDIEKECAKIDVAVEWCEKRIENEDWSESWKEHYNVLHYGKRIQVVPEWLKPDYPEDIVIRIEPGMAFGTGEHETTSLCMNWLEELIKPDEKPEMAVFDVGTGSGILAIAARALGADRVDAMDYDQVAVMATVKNAAMNNASIIIYKSDLLKDCVGQADLIIANIVADVIIRLVPELDEHLKENGRFLCSGVLVEREKDVTAALEEAGYTVIERREDGEWCALLAARAEEVA